MDREAIIAALSRNEWFAGLRPALAQDIVQLGRMRRVRDTLLFAVGDEPNGLFAMLSGEVRISHTSTDGRLALLLVARTGSWFGETSLFDGRLRYSDAFAAGRCEVLHLSMSAFRRITNDDASRYAAFVRLLCDHHRLAMDHIASLGALPVNVRLAQRLLFFSRAQCETGRPDDVVRLSQEDLASNVGVSRQALSSHLKELERSGVISIGYATIRLHNRQALEQLIIRRGGATEISADVA